MFRVCLLMFLGVCIGGSNANYTFPLGGPYLQHPQPFQPYQPHQLTQTRRLPYTPPTYLPPPPPSPPQPQPQPANNYNRETQKSYTENSYYNYEENRSNRNNINNEFYQGNVAPKAESYEYQNPANDKSKEAQEFPGRPGGFTRVQGGQGKAQLHAVLDYDDDYYEDESGTSSGPGSGSGSSHGQAATPIQGPIFVQNGSVPVVPLYSYPVLNNGSFVQIPILWSALSVALGLEVRGQLIRGVPCVKRFHQLFCPTAGNTYPIDRIEHFIDENKALMKRMYGDFTVFTEYGAPRRGKRGAPEESEPFDGDAEVHSHWAEKYTEPDTKRKTRQAQTTRARPSSSGSSTPPFTNTNQGNSSGRVDACESKMEILTPYWALNSAGKVRAVVNTMHFEQAIHQEVCSKTQTNRCAGDCGCEQKYKWHRLLAYDPDQDCAGIFMDWFLFPSCCVCRCTP